MENKINLVEILKDCPQGMELDCTLLDNTEFEELDFNFHNYPIVIRNSKTKATIYLTEYGQFVNEENYKCIIFPKGKNTWEGFVPPCQFKDGDIIYTLLDNDLEFISIFKETSKTHIYTYATLGLTFYRENIIGLCRIDDIVSQRLATEDEKQRLFDAIKDNGYKWNTKTKSLEKLIIPKFKEGDKVIRTDTHEIYIIDHITSSGYVYKNGGGTGFIFEDEHLYELAPNKFDINTLVPFESRVLMRDYNNSIWIPALWGIYNDNDISDYPYKLIGTMSRYCIPYEGNEHLLGTANDCDSYFKTWE